MNDNMLDDQSAKIAILEALIVINIIYNIFASLSLNFNGQAYV